MGWETLAIAGYSALQAKNSMDQGTAAAKAATQEAQYKTMQVADQTVRQAGSLKTSFLQSGLTLEGGPMDVLTQAFNKGQTDIGRIAASANITAKNDINTARTKALQGLAGSAGSAFAFTSFANDFGGGFSSGFDNAATFQTGASLGPANSFYSMGPFSNDPLPWRS